MTINAGILGVRGVTAGAVLLAGAWGTGAARADTAVIGASQDTTLYQDKEGSLGNGAGVYFFTGMTAIAHIRRGLIRFDVAAAIPDGATINGVSLRLHMSRTSAQELDTTLHRALAAWGEGASNAAGEEGGGADAAEGDATWLHTFFPGMLWTAPGGDFEAEPSATQLVAGVGFYTWTSEQMTADVQQWLDNPAGNFGWLVRGNEDGSFTAKRFDTRESGNAAFRPVLTIDFTPAGSDCPPDWDMSGALNSNDFFAFLTDFFAGKADYDASGETNSDDFAAFLTDFFEGCA